MKIKMDVEWRRQRAERRSQPTSQVPSRAVGKGLKGAGSSMARGATDRERREGNSMSS